MSITRLSASGLLDRNEDDDGSFPFVTGEWGAPTGWNKSLSSGRLVFTATGNHAPNWAVNNNVSGLDEMMVYMKMDVLNTLLVGAGVLVSNNVAGTQDGIDGLVPNGFSGFRLLRHWEAGVPTTMDATGSVTVSSPIEVSLWADDALDAAMYDHNNAAMESGTFGGVKTGKAGIFCDFASSGQVIAAKKYFIFAGRYVSVEGLSTGDKAKIRDSGGVVLAEATESGGTAVIDCLTIKKWWDIHDLRVTDSADVVLDEFVGDVWAGETWEYVTSANPPATPTISATTTGAHSATVEGSAYSHPDDSPIAAINWQVATDAGFTTDLQDVEIEYDDPDDAPDPPTYNWDLPDDNTLHYTRVRYKAANGLYSAFSSADTFTTDNEDNPDTPTILTAVVTATTVVLTATAYVDPFDREHMQSEWLIDLSGGDYIPTVVESLEDGVNLITITMGGLTNGTAYIAKHRQRADDGTWSAYSASKAFTTLTTPTNRPAQPVITASEVASTSFRATTTPYSDPTGSPHKATQWFILIDDPSNTGFPNFAPGWGYYVNASTAELTRVFSGLAQGRNYGIAVRHQAFDLDWSDWSAFVEVLLPEDPLEGKALRIVSPHHGAKSKTTFSITFSPASISGTTFEADYALAEPLGDWESIFSGEEDSGQIWNVNELATAWYLLRLRAVNEDTATPYEYRLVLVDQEDVAYDNEVGSPAWENSLNESDIVWTPKDDTSDWRLAGGAGITDDANLIACKLRTDIGPFRAFDMAVSFVVGSSGGPFAWARYPEQVWRGPCWALKESEIVGVVPYAGIFPLIYSVPIDPYGTGDPLTRGTGPLFLSVQGWDEYSAGVGGHQFMSVEEEIGVHSFIDNFNIAGVMINKYPEYGGRMRVTTISVGEGERTIRLQIAIYGTGVEPPPSGWHIDMSVTTNIFCAYCGDAGKTITQTQDPYGDFFGMTVLPLVACSEEAPIEGGDAPEEEEDEGSLSSIEAGASKVWAVDLPRFHKTGVGVWHRRSRDTMRPAIVETRQATYVGIGNTVFQFERTGTDEGYWTSPMLNRKDRFKEYTLARVILRYESEDDTIPIIEASGDGGATWSAGLKVTVAATTTSGTQTKRMVQGFNKSGPDLRFRITFPADVKLLVHTARAEIVERGDLQSE